MTAMDVFWVAVTVLVGLAVTALWRALARIAQLPEAVDKLRETVEHAVERYRDHEARLRALEVPAQQQKAGRR
ncbi:MAG: hypothetical protein QM714_19465 [Nocardioides sp.]|uniref:hypothetical protein n=1 Tax=Nocardioides sp. TaxID=35761 RepID=UPI0039E4BC0D